MKFVVSETNSSTWNYHLRQVGPTGVHLSGAANLTALCGKRLGWDTQIPVESYGTSGNVPARWCAACRKLMEERLAVAL
jgi:hypothetical protein